MNHSPEVPDNDPLGLEAADREIRIEKLRSEIDRVAGGKLSFGEEPGCDPRIEEAFLQHVIEFESQEPVRPLDEFRRAGLDLPPPESLDDDALTEKLWELIRAMADHRMFLERTDHLSDRAPKEKRPYDRDRHLPQAGS